MAMKERYLMNYTTNDFGVTIIRQLRRSNFIHCVGYILVCAFVTGMFLVSGYLDTHYSFKGSVVEIENDIVVVEDFGGYQWEVYADGYQVGDNVKVYVDANGTSTYDDDKIVDLKRLDN
jgi:hypothetical protein